MDQTILTPPDPHVAVRAFEQYLWRAQARLDAARTPVERQEAQWWVDNAERGLAKWKAVAERQVRP